VVEKTNALRSDLVVITGDLVDAPSGSSRRRSRRSRTCARGAASRS
jgi:3',5'-cyclic AMP phosphodiesterase CpdA